MGKYIPELRGRKICVPPSGDNHAVFAFAMLGTQVTSCDISENQLANAERVAKQHRWDKSIEFLLRPFDDHLKVEKPYDRTGPFESEIETTFAWRVMGIMNAMLDSGLIIKCLNARSLPCVERT
jgi:hypothetical protein